jgi:hypothetical protein
MASTSRMLGLECSSGSGCVPERADMGDSVEGY